MYDSKFLTSRSTGTSLGVSNIPNARVVARATTTVSRDVRNTRARISKSISFSVDYGFAGATATQDLGFEQLIGDCLIHRVLRPLYGTDRLKFKQRLRLEDEERRIKRDDEFDTRFVQACDSG